MFHGNDCNHPQLRAKVNVIRGTWLENIRYLRNDSRLWTWETVRDRRLWRPGGYNTTDGNLWMGIRCTGNVTASVPVRMVASDREKLLLRLHQRRSSNEVSTKCARTLRTYRAFVRVPLTDPRIPGRDAEAGYARLFGSNATQRPPTNVNTYGCYVFGLRPFMVAKLREIYANWVSPKRGCSAIYLRY